MANFNNDDDIMKAIMGGGDGGGNIDDELAELEAEVGGKKGDDDELAALENEIDDEENPKTKAKERKKSDDDLAALEKEGLDDVDLEDEKETKKPPAQTKKPEPKKEQPKPQPKKEEPKPQPKQQAPKGPDLYPEKTEKKYHSVDKMTSIGVLNEEKELCDKIIEYKKKIGADYDDWEIKKDNVKDKIDTVSSFVQDGVWDLDKYKKNILEQYKWEVKLLQFVEKDPSLNEQQKKVLKDRVNKRKQIIDTELKENPEEEGEKSAEQPKQESKKEEAPKGPDLYPEKTEKKYHNVDKMTSIGVLNEEKELCDKIIEYKKKIGADYDDWEIKKDNVKDKIDTVSSFVQDGVWDLDKYKKNILEQYKWEVKLLQFVEKDPSLNEQQKKVLKDRVNKRKQIIDAEIKQNPEDEEEPPQKEEPKKEETKKGDDKKEEKKDAKIELKKSLSPLFSVPKDKEEEEKKRINDVVVDRLNEYRAALAYFQANELAEQRVDATNKAKLICIELKKIQDGKWKEVNEFKLPDPVTPEYIYGYKKEERNERFKKIILDYDKQRKEAVSEMTAKIEAFKKLPAVKFKKIKDVATKDLNAIKAKKETLDKLINLLKQYFQDTWTPAPLYAEQDKEIKIEKVNKDIPEFTLRIIFGKTTYSKDKSLYLIVRYSDPEKKLEKKFEQKKAGNWEQQFDWKFEKGDFKSIYRNKIHVEIWEKKLIFKDALKGQFDMEPKELKGQIEVTKDWPITLEDGKTDKTANVTFKVHSPCKEPLFEIQTKTVLQVTKIYKPFNLKGDNANQSAIKMDIQTPQINPQNLAGNSSTSQAKPTQGGKQPARPQGQAAKPKQTPGAKPGAGPKKPGAPIDKSQFNDEELKDPDCIDCLKTLSVLQFKQNKYEEISKKIDGRTPRELMQRIIRIRSKYKALENSLGEDISPQDYLALLKVTFDHDKKLADYFKQIGDKEKFILVNERLPLIFKETEELMKQMPK